MVTLEVHDAKEVTVPVKHEAAFRQAISASRRHVIMRTIPSGDPRRMVFVVSGMPAGTEYMMLDIYKRAVTERAADEWITLASGIKIRKEAHEQAVRPKPAAAGITFRPGAEITGIQPQIPVGAVTIKDTGRPVTGIVTERVLEQERRKEEAVEKEMERIYERAGPIEKAGLHATTAFSPKMWEYAWSYFPGGRAPKEVAIGKLYEAYKAPRDWEYPFWTAVGAGAEVGLIALPVGFALGAGARGAGMIISKIPTISKIGAAAARYPGAITKGVYLGWGGYEVGRGAITFAGLRGLPPGEIVERMGAMYTRDVISFGAMVKGFKVGWTAPEAVITKLRGPKYEVKRLKGIVTGERGYAEVEGLPKGKALAVEAYKGEPYRERIFTAEELLKGKALTIKTEMRVTEMGKAFEREMFEPKIETRIIRAKKPPKPEELISTETTPLYYLEAVKPTKGPLQVRWLRQDLSIPIKIPKGKPFKVTTLKPAKIKRTPFELGMPAPAPVSASALARAEHFGLGRLPPAPPRPVLLKPTKKIPAVARRYRPIISAEEVKPSISAIGFPAPRAYPERFPGLAGPWKKKRIPEVEYEFYPIPKAMIAPPIIALGLKKEERVAPLAVAPLVSARGRRAITTPEIVMPGAKLDIRPVLDVGIREEVDLGFKQMTGQIQKRGTALRLQQTMVSEMLLPPPPFTPVPVGFAFPWLGEGWGAKRMKRKRPRQPKEYSPSLIAIVHDIRSLAPLRMPTGVGIRPIPIRGLGRSSRRRR